MLNVSKIIQVTPKLAYHRSNYVPCPRPISVRGRESLWGQWMSCSSAVRGFAAQYADPDELEQAKWIRAPALEMPQHCLPYCTEIVAESAPAFVREVFVELIP